MGWFKSKRQGKVEKIEEALRGFDETHKYISNDGQIAMVLDDKKQVLGFINLEWGSGKLETMAYNEIDAISFTINHLSVGGVIDLLALNKNETLEFFEWGKREVLNAIEKTDLFYEIGLKVDSELMRKEFPVTFFFCGTGMPPASKTTALVQSSIEKFLEMKELLRKACLMTKEDH